MVWLQTAYPKFPSFIVTIVLGSKPPLDNLVNSIEDIVLNREFLPINEIAYGKHSTHGRGRYYD